MRQEYLCKTDSTLTILQADTGFMARCTMMKLYQKGHMTAEWRNKMLNKLLKSVLDQDTAPVVVCDMDDIIVYMNPSAIARYHKDLTGRSIKDCHPPKANEMIEKVLAWFKESKDNNIIYTYRNDEENKDVYMVALRDDDGTLIGYYEKHEYRNKETVGLYQPKK